MRKRRSRRLVARISAFVVCSAGVGCQAVLGPGDPVPAPRTPAPAVVDADSLLRPWSMIDWSVTAPQGPASSMAGTSMVAPTGTVELGPYGSVAVAGLTPRQAEGAIAKQVARYVRGAKVTVRRAAAVAAPEPDDAVRADWRPAPSDGPSLERAQAEEEPEAPTAEIAAQATPGAWRPLPRSDNGSVPPALTGSWRPLERGADLNEEPIIRSRTWLFAPEAPSPVTPVGLGTEAGPELFPPPTQTAKVSEPDKSESAPAPKPLPAPTPVPNVPPAAAIPAYGAHDGSVPRECTKTALPSYVIEAPDILLIESTQKIPDQPVRGQHLVRPDGTVSLGIYGSAFVAGMTIDQARVSIGQVLAQRIKDFDLRNLNVDVLAYNSKFYYVITDGGGYGEQVYRFPVTGSETVLDAIALINGLPPVASKKAIWLARRNCHEGAPQVLPVDWIGITQGGATATNYQVLPGDRIYVQSDHWVRFDSAVAKRISPFERMFGFTLLGSETVNSIRGRGLGGSSP